MSDLDFYFDFSSPYGYLASQKIEALAAKHGRGVDWHPHAPRRGLQADRAAPRSRRCRSRARTSRHDFARSARFHGIAFNMPPVFPIPVAGAVAHRAVGATPPTAAGGRHGSRARSIMRTSCEGRDISQADVAAEVAGRAGFDAARPRARRWTIPRHQGSAEARSRSRDCRRRVRLALRRGRRRAVLGPRPLRPGRALARHRRLLTLHNERAAVAEYTLYGFAQSGNCYKVALALELAGADWAPRFVDYFGGETRTPAYRAINVMGEAPVLEHGGAPIFAVGRDPRLPRGDARPLRLARRRRAPRDPALDCSSTITSSRATPRPTASCARSRRTRTRTCVAEFRKRAEGAWSVLDAHLAGPQPMWWASDSPIADLSLCGYLLLRPTSSASTGQARYPQHRSLARAHPRARRAGGHPYELLPGHPRPVDLTRPPCPCKQTAADSVTTLAVTARNGIGIVTLDRPELHNAFNEVLIAELTAAAARRSARPTTGARR